MVKSHEAKPSAISPLYRKRVEYIPEFHDCPCYKYKLGYVKRGSTAFKVQKDGCGVPSAARTLLGPEGLLMR